MTFVALPIARNNWAYVANLSGFCCHGWLRLEVSTRVMFERPLIKSLIFLVKFIFSVLAGLSLYHTLANESHTSV